MKQYLFCFLLSLIRDERQIDFAEQLESVAYVICGENTINFDTFVQVWSARGIVDKFYRLIGKRNKIKLLRN